MNMTNNINFNVDELDVLCDDIKATIAHVILHYLKCRKLKTNNKILFYKLEKIVDEYNGDVCCIIEIEKLQKLKQETFFKIIDYLDHYLNCWNTFFFDLDDDNRLRIFSEYRLMIKTLKNFKNK